MSNLTNDEKLLSAELIENKLDLAIFEKREKSPQHQARRLFANLIRQAKGLLLNQPLFKCSNLRGIGVPSF